MNRYDEDDPAARVYVRINSKLMEMEDFKHLPVEIKKLLPTLLSIAWIDSRDEEGNAFLEFPLYNRLVKWRPDEPDSEVLCFLKMIPMCATIFPSSCFTIISPEINVQKILDDFLKQF